MAFSKLASFVAFVLISGQLASAFPSPPGDVHPGPPPPPDFKPGPPSPPNGKPGPPGPPGDKPGPPGKQVTCKTGQKTSNAACCALFPIVAKIQKDLFNGGECGEEAHSALRIAFHDAIGFSLHGKKGGGADGSILAFNKTETALEGNEGISDITNDQYPVWVESGLTAGDFLHLAGAIGTANCPGAPRLQYMHGRPPPKGPAAPGTVPEPTDSASAILARLADAGFSPAETVALLASHTIAAVDDIDPSIPGTPLDSTVSTFDTQFFLEVMLKGTSYPGARPHPGEVKAPIIGEMRLQSDFAISRDPRTACMWQAMIGNQELMVNQFKDAMARLQVLGQDPHKLIDCSDVIPVPKGLPKGSKIAYPPTLSRADLELQCPLIPLPKIDTTPGPALKLDRVLTSRSLPDLD